jgi:hypothetical protein
MLNKEPIISTCPDGKFTLRPIKPETSLNGIDRKITDDAIEVNYQSRFALFDEATMSSKPVTQEKSIRTKTHVPKIGVMLVGLGGNNGSTFTAGCIANKKNLSWATK